MGSGGSNNLIYIGHDYKNKHNKYVIKLIPRFMNKLLKKQEKRDQNEIIFYKLFTRKIIEKNISPHIVMLYAHNTCNDIHNIINFKCPTIDMMLKKKYDYFIENFCKKNEHVVSELKNTCDIVMLEYCNSSLSQYLEFMMHRKNIKYLPKFLDRCLFQIIFTLVGIRSKFPSFHHRDMFIRNILGVTVTKYNINDYVEYKYNDTVFYLKANGFCPKINDFGFSYIKELNGVSKEHSSDIKNNKTDLFCLLYDLYDGNNMGAYSLKTLVVKYKHKSYKLPTQFSSLGITAKNKQKFA